MEKLSDSDAKAVCKKLAETIDDDKMVESINQSSVTKEDMINYVRDSDNIQRIKSATEMKEFLETDQLQQIDDFQEFKSGCDSQLSEISRDEDQSMIEKRKEKRRERQDSNKRKYAKKLKFSQHFIDKYEIK